ncbi:MAG: FKBP-type peptidyl-prolyl cis-trans isomerase [Waddliaceae bacterium]
MFENRFHFLCLATILSAFSLSSQLNGADQTQTSGSYGKEAGSYQEDREESRRLSEAFGHFIGRNLKNPGIDFDLELIIKGMRAGASGLPAPMPDEEYEQLMVKSQARAFQAISEKNLAEANAFLQDNAGKSGVVELQPGKLQYLVLTRGSGETVKEKSVPSVSYTGKFISGEVFGSSDQTGGPISIPIEQTISGFQQGLVGMKEGEKRRLFVHPDLGYSTSGQLPPNSLLIFDIEVIKANVGEEQEDETEDEEIYDPENDVDLEEGKVGDHQWQQW